MASLFTSGGSTKEGNLVEELHSEKQTSMVVEKNCDYADLMYAARTQSSSHSPTSFLCALTKEETSLTATRPTMCTKKFQLES